MPEAPKPSPPPDGGVSRNLFVEADPDLDALIESTADEPARAARVARRGRALVVFAEQHRSPHSRRAHDVERFARPNGGVAQLLAVARHALRQTDAAAGRLLRGLADRPYRALAAIVALAGLLIAFSWLVLDVRDTSRARAAADGRLPRTAADAQVRGGEDRGADRRAAPARAERAANPSEHGAHRADGRPSPAGRANAADRPPPIPSSSLTVMSPQPQQSPAAMPAPGMPAASAITVRHPEGSIRVSAPTDVPLSELLLDLVELAGLPDHDGWALGPLDGDAYPPHRTLAQLDVDDGALLALRELPGDGSAAGESATTQRMIARPPLGPTAGAGGRPLSDRSARILPVRLSIPARCLSVLGALARGERGEPHCDLESASPRPGRVHASRPALAASRVRKAWAHSDYRQRLERDDRGAAPATVRDDRGRLAQGRGRQDDHHRAARIAAGVPAPRPSDRGRDQPRLGVARPPAGARPLCLHRRTAHRPTQRARRLPHAA